jgi:hypothetical protein
VIKDKEKVSEAFNQKRPGGKMVLASTFSTKDRKLVPVSFCGKECGTQ